MTQLIAMAIVVGILTITAYTLARDSVQIATIGGTPVTALRCYEDEAIFWTGIDTLGCVHADNLGEEQ